MAKTNSKKVMLADDLERIVAGVVSDKTKEYLNNGYILADFKEFQSDRTFKVLLFDDLNPENDFQVILVETNYIYRLEDTTLFKGFISTSKFTKVFTGTLARESEKNIAYIQGYFDAAAKDLLMPEKLLDEAIESAARFKGRKLEDISPDSVFYFVMDVMGVPFEPLMEQAIDKGFLVRKK